MERLSFAEYARLGGTVEEAAFGPLLHRAWQRMDRATHGRLAAEAPLRECAKRCLTELIGLYAEDTRFGGREIASQQNGDLRVSFVEGSARSSRRDVDVLRLWLLGEADARGVALLYCGAEDGGTV